MFWKLSFRQPSAIDSLLEKEECTLGDILDEDDVLQECKTQNKKLIDFLVKPEIFTQLVKFVCEEPDDDVEDKVRFKYPHIACELLVSEVFTIIEQLVGNDDYLAMLWSFLDKPPPLNPLMGSFVSKVLAMLLVQRTQVVLNYMQRRENFMNNFLRHLGTSAMMDLLLQMVIVPDNDPERFNLVNWLREQGVVEKLLDFVHPSADPDQCANASQALCDMLRVSRDSSQLGTHPLLCAMDSEETMKRLMENMFSSENPPDHIIVNGIQFLLTCLERRNGGPSPTMGRPPITPQMEDYPPSTDSMSERVLTAVVPVLSKFHDLLSRTPQLQCINTTFGTLEPPLGNMRLQVVRLLSALLATHDTPLQRKVISLGTFNFLMELFFQYPWNNFLHAQVEACVSAALTSTMPTSMDDDTGQPNENVTLRHHLLSDCDFLQKVLSGVDRNKHVVEEKGRRQGYMGHLIRMANHMAENPRNMSMSGRGTLTRGRGAEEEGSAAPECKLPSELDEGVVQQWNEFITGPLAEMNKKNDTNLGGQRPMTSSLDDSDEEFDQLNVGPDNELEKAYQQYQDTRFSSNFIEDFGVEDEMTHSPLPYSAVYTNLTTLNCTVAADEEQTQSMAAFEAAFAERIQVFNDSESDEEESSTWAEKGMALASPTDQHSLGSSGAEGEEEGDEQGRPREFVTGSSDDDDEGVSISERRKHKNQHRSGNIAEVISWRSEFATDEALSGVMDNTSGGPSDWTQEPVATSSAGSNPGNWADFSVFSSHNKLGQKTSVDRVTGEEATPTAVTVTYVNVDKDGEKPMTHSPHNAKLYSRLSEGSEEGDEDMVIDHELLEIDVVDGSSGSNGSHSSSSDDERSGTYSFNSDSEELLNTNGKLADLQQKSGQVASPPKDSNEGSPGAKNSPVLVQKTFNSVSAQDNNDHTRPQVDGEEEDLEDNFMFLSKQGMLSGTIPANSPEALEKTRAQALEACIEYESKMQSKNSSHS